MNTLLQQLLDLTARLTLAAGSAADALLVLRRHLAAWLIQQNPGFAPVPADPDADPELLQAAREGEALAAELNAAGVQLQWSREPYLAPDTRARRPRAVLGPFVDDDLALLQFVFDQTQAMRTVVGVLNLPFIDVREPLLRIPADSQPDADDPRRWMLAAGSLWIRADRLAADATGFVGLRIAGGLLEVGDAPAPVEPDGTLLVPLTAPWRLEVEPEAAPAAEAGSDGAALALQLPARLTLRNGQPPVLEGGIALSGFGAALSFAATSGTVVVGGDAIAFAYDIGGAEWRVDALRSTLFQAEGRAEVAAAVWSLPRSAAPLEQLGEADHGGSIGLLLRDGPALRLPGATGACRARDSVVGANANGLDWRVRRADDNLALELALWDGAASRLGGGAPRLAGLRVASRRGGADVVVLEGGRMVNAWDRPLAADGTPFEFDGPGQTLSLIAEPDGLQRAAASAARELVVDSVLGLALDNLYLHLRPAERSAFVGSGTLPLQLDEGRARLVCEVLFAQPMLPDPYANNWDVTHLNVGATPAGLRAEIGWTAGTPPALQTRLAEAISLPSPPPDALADDRARNLFRGNLDAERTHLALLDLSGHDQQFGIALEATEFTPLEVDAQQRLQWPLRHVRLLMPPQVHWEPVQVLADVRTATKFDEVVRSRSHGGPTLVGSTDAARVPALPGLVGDEIAARANGERRSAALFGLPFGLHAVALMERRFEADGVARPMLAAMHQPGFVERAGDVFEAARQLRLLATGAGLPEGPDDPLRSMPGALVQTDNLQGNANALPNVLNVAVQAAVDKGFENRLPLHHADLSGYGLSCFSRWRRPPPPPAGDEETGVTQVRFDVLVGRTAYEVIELQSRLWTPQCRMVRTIILERGNSGRVTRHDSGWNAVEDGDCRRYAPIETGVVQAFRRIRNVRITPRPPIVVDPVWSWQEVLYDADLHLAPEPGNAAADRTVPVRDHYGYIQVTPVDVLGPDGKIVVAATPREPQFDALMKVLGRPVGGAVDAAIRLGGTLPMQLISLEVARDAGNPVPPRFTLAVSGSPGLPRAGQWTPVRIDGATQQVAPVDPRRGVPVVRREGEAAFVFREAALAHQAAPASEFGWLMGTPSGRVLFPAPSVVPGQGEVRTAAPRVADAYALSQTSGLFPRPAFALKCLGPAAFQVTPEDAWKLLDTQFDFTPPAAGIAQGADWAIERGLAPGVVAPKIDLALDTLAGAAPWFIALPQPDDLRLHVDPFPDALFILRSAFRAAGDGASGLVQPSMVLGPALKEVQEIVDALGAFIKLGFDVDVDVAAGSGPVPSFVVRLRMELRLPKETNERIDIGVGKFLGRFELRGQLEADLAGKTRGRIGMELSGDVQQGIIPPVLYAGGEFRFVLEIDEDGKPLIELGLGTAASIGGDLIKNLIELEATVRYGYTLIPQTLQPGVMLGIEARAKLLAGLLGLSFSVDTLARLMRVGGGEITIWAELRAAATVQVAWLLKEKREIRTQFEQTLPLAPFAVLAGANPITAMAASVLL